jgi:hypothetical protein
MAALEASARLAARDPLLMPAVSAAFLLGLAVALLTRGRRRGPVMAAMAVAVMLALGSVAFAHGYEDHGGPAKGAPLRGAALLDPARAPPDLAQRRPDGSVFVPKPTQRLLGLRTTMTERATFPRTVELSAGVARVPLLDAAATPGREILHPVAVTLLGGPISATLLDTVLTPVLFLRFGAKPLERLRVAQGETPDTPHSDGAEPRPVEAF